MPDVQEVFRMATQKVRPDEGFVDRQLEHQRRRSRNRRVGTYVLVGAIGIVGAIVAFSLGFRGDQQVPATRPTQAPVVAEALELSDLVGVWFEVDGSHLLNISRDGSYALDDSGLLDTSPDDAGSVEIGDDGSIRFVSSAASRECTPGATWVWRSAELEQRGLLRVAEADTACPAGVLGSSSWGLVGGGPVSPLSEPVPGPDQREGRPITRDDLIGFWDNPNGPGLFRFSADGTFAGYFPESLDSPPLLTGTWEVRGNRIRQVFTSTRIPGCTAGDVEVFEAELIELADGVALRTNVLRSCGEILPPPVQVRISPR